jgi:hypothetical protein
VESQRSDNGQHNVGGRPGGSDQNHAAAWPPKRAKIDRHWLGVAEQEWGAGQEAGQQDRPKRVNVFERIKTNATEPPSRVVTKKMRRETVTHLSKNAKVVTRHM